MTRWQKFRAHLADIPVLAYLLGFGLASAIELFVGNLAASLLGLPTMPTLFGIILVQQSLALLPGVIAYDLLIYLLPTYIMARLAAPFVKKWVQKVPPQWGLFAHVLALFLVALLWGGFHEYRTMILCLMGINFILCISLNLVNGYMGEFSVGHAGFMGVGAYIASILTVWVFPRSLGHLVFPLALLAGGAGAAIAGLLVAIPSFKIRGDYLAIITLATNFIIKNGIDYFRGNNKRIQDHLPKFQFLYILQLDDRLNFWNLDKITN